MLIGGTLLVLLLTIILVVIIRRKKSCRSGGGAGGGGGSSRATTRSGQSLLWPLPSQPWSSCDPSKDVHPQLGPDYAEVFHHSNPMSSFAAQPTAAYASTTLIRNSSSLPFRYQTAGRSIPQLDSSYSNSVRNSSQQLVPNWLELLPPPPQHPPPPIITPDCSAKSDYPSFLTATLPSTIHTPSANPNVHYPFRSSFNAQSHPTLIPRNIRNSFQSNRNSAIRYVNDENQVEGLYATCTYDQIEPYPLSSYRWELLNNNQNFSIWHQIQAILVNRVSSDFALPLFHNNILRLFIFYSRVGSSCLFGFSKFRSPPPILVPVLFLSCAQ